MKVRTNGGKDQSMRRNNDHSRFQLDITQLAINSHSIHCWESINRVALQDRECYNPLSLLVPAHLVFVVELSQGVPGGAGRAPGLHHRGHGGARHQPAQAQLWPLRAADIVTFKVVSFYWQTKSGIDYWYVTHSLCTFESWTCPLILRDSVTWCQMTSLSLLWLTWHLTPLATDLTLSSGCPHHTDTSRPQPPDPPSAVLVSSVFCVLTTGMGRSQSRGGVSPN